MRLKFIACKYHKNSRPTTQIRLLGQEMLPAVPPGLTRTGRAHFAAYQHTPALITECQLRRTYSRACGSVSGCPQKSIGRCLTLLRLHRPQLSGKAGDRKSVV